MKRLLGRNNIGEFPCAINDFLARLVQANRIVPSLREAAELSLACFSWSHKTVADNEYLDASKARRWQSVAQAIRDGSSSLR